MVAYRITRDSLYLALPPVNRSAGLAPLDVRSRVVAYSAPLVNAVLLERDVLLLYVFIVDELE